MAGGEGMGNLGFPWSRRRLLHFIESLDAMMREGFFLAGVPGRHESLRLCQGSPRYSEDDFAGSTSFDMDTLKGFGSCISDLALGMGDDDDGPGQGAETRRLMG